MLGNFGFDTLVEKMSRRVAGRTSRRGALGRLGTVLAGVSAGMNCWFAGSSTDSFGPLAPLADGLGLVDASAC